MKTIKILLLAFLMILGLSSVKAQGNQKFAYVDTEYILQNIPEYGDAQEEINQMSVTWQKELKALQMQYFGPEGELFSKRIELIQPIQEKIYNAITQVAQIKNYAFVFDKAAGTTILYCNDKFDISDDVLDEIGNVMQTVRRQDRKRGGNAGVGTKPAGDKK